MKVPATGPAVIIRWLLPQRFIHVFGASHGAPRSCHNTSRSQQFPEAARLRRVARDRDCAVTAL